MSNVDFKNFKDFTKALEKEVTDLSKQDQVPVEDILTASFISKNTPYTDLGEFLEAGGFSVSTQEEFESIDDSEINAFVSDKTRFSNFQEMVDTAGQEYVENRFKKLGFK
jgi:hypothetical protein